MSTNNSEMCTPVNANLHRCVSVLPNDYNILENKPKLNGQTLEGDLTVADLGGLSSNIDDYSAGDIGETDGYIIVLDGGSAKKIPASDIGAGAIQINGGESLVISGKHALNIVAGDNVELTPEVDEEGNLKLTVKAKDSTYVAGNGIIIDGDNKISLENTGTEYRLALSGHMLTLQSKGFEDAEWSDVQSFTLPDDDTTYTFGIGSADGAIAVNGVDIAVKGLGSAAYTSSDDYDRAGVAADVLGTPGDDSTEFTVYGARALAEEVRSVANDIKSDVVEAQNDIDEHVSKTDNPHGVTASQLGLGDVVNAGMDRSVTENSEKYITSGAVKAYVDAAIKAVKQFAYEVVSALPDASEATMNKIYLTACSHGDSDCYDEYITVQSDGSYKWEKIGNTDINLSEYAKAKDVVIKTLTIAGIDLQDDISAEELRAALNVEDGANNYSHPVYTPKESGLYKVTVDEAGHISEVADVEKSDITALGIPGGDTTYELATDTTDGLMSGADKAKLDGIAEGATANTGTITEVVMNGISRGTEGAVDLGTVLMQDAEQYEDKTPEEVKEKYMIFLGAEGDISKVKLSELVEWVAVAVEEILTAVTQQNDMLYIDTAEATQTDDVLEVE